MYCPKCRKMVLKRPNSWSRGPEPLQCPTCRGYWFEATILRQVGLGWPEPMAVPDSTTPPNDASAGLCPHGHGILRRAPVPRLDFFLDRCSTCLGVWFDAGEWTRLAQSQLLETLPEIWSESWQRDQRSRRSAARHLVWAEEAFGTELFGKLLDVANRLADHPRRSEALAFLQVVSQDSGLES